MLDCKKDEYGKKKNKAPKLAPSSADTVTNPNQLWTRYTWQPKKNVSSIPHLMELGLQESNVDNLDSCLESKPNKPLTSMLTQKGSKGYG